MSAGAGPGGKLLLPAYPCTELAPQYLCVALYRADHVIEPFNETGIFFRRYKIPCVVGKTGVLDFPLFDFDWQPKGIDTECDNGQKQPFQPAADELHTGAIEKEPSAADVCVLFQSGFLPANCPRVCEAEGDSRDEYCCQIYTQQSEHRSRENTLVITVSFQAFHIDTSCVFLR